MAAWFGRAATLWWLPLRTMSLLFLPGGGLVAPVNFASGLTNSKSRQKVFVAEAGKAPTASCSKKGQGKTDGDGKEQKAPAFGGRLNGLVDSCKAPSNEFVVKSSLSTKEVPARGHVDSMGETTLNVSVGSSAGFDSSARWVKPASKKFHQFGLYGLTAVPEFDVSLDAPSSHKEPAKATLKFGGATWSPKLCSNSVTRDTLSFNVASSLVVSREPVKLPLALSKEVVSWIHGRTGGVAAGSRFPTVWDTDLSISPAASSVTSSVRGYVGHGLHWGLTSTLRASGTKEAKPSDGADGEGKDKKPASPPQRYSVEGRLMVAHKRVEATGKATVTPKSLATTFGVFTSVLAPLDVGIQVSVPVVTFPQPNAASQREQSRGKSPGGGSRASKVNPAAKLAGKLNLGKSESISVACGLNDGKIGIGYKWEGRLTWLAGIRKPSAGLTQPVMNLAVDAPTTVNVFGPVGAEAVMDATTSIRAIREAKPLVVLSTRAEHNVKPKAPSEPNNLVLSLGADMDIKAKAMVQKMGGSLQVKL